MTQAILGFFTPWIIYLVITLLHYFLPARKIVGYVRNSETGELLTYRLNGIFVLALTIALWFLSGYMGWMPFDWLYQIRWYSLAGAFSMGLLFSLLIVLPNSSTGKSFAADLFLGRLENPQTKNKKIDAKVWLYLIGAVMLQLHVLSFMAHQWMMPQQLNSATLLCGILLTYFVWDYLTFEHVHLYTYDFFAERVGFKLGWGCLIFYPYFYFVSMWATIDLPDPMLSMWQLAGIAVIFICGWMFARGANMQKYFFKTQPQKSFLGIRPQTVSDGSKSLLVNGFWGLSRHVNYLGEVLMGTAIALSVGYPGVWWVWLYPLYYVLLFITRQIDDDKRCAAKYGDLWNQYKSKVKYRIIPFIY
jgi:delta14-sterol reductase